MSRTSVQGRDKYCRSEAKDQRPFEFFIEDNVTAVSSLMRYLLCASVRRTPSTGRTFGASNENRVPIIPCLCSIEFVKYARVTSCRRILNLLESGEFAEIFSSRVTAKMLRANRSVH